MSALDYYQVLEIKPDAKPDEIRKAYFRLAKMYHPDLSTGGDSAENTECFLNIQKAYEILSSVEKRRNYDAIHRQTRPGEGAAATAEREAKSAPRPAWVRKPSIDEERDARKAYSRIDTLMEQGDFERAAEVLRVIVKTIPNDPEYQSKYGYVMANLGGSLHKARDMCRRAVEAEPYNADYHAQLGFVYLQAGLTKTAMDCFDTALSYDPGHSMALRFHAKEDGKNEGLLGKLTGLFSR